MDYKPLNKIKPHRVPAHLDKWICKKWGRKESSSLQWTSDRKWRRVVATCRMGDQSHPLPLPGDSSPVVEEEDAPPKHHQGCNKLTSCAS